ncbi:MAG: hypothetical protein HON90_00655 [Halobacteriovoraceae bacterium]|jgi:hypothetical protein|nr:hypothetical protein [Halobacteriovoraceae bacterium]
MKTAFSICFVFFCLQSLACELNEKIVSLSGPITMLLEELNLQNDKNLLAVSKFHPLKEKFKGEILAGGLFLSKKTLIKYSKTKIFFDKSREFKNLMKRSHIKNTIEVDTRDQDPFEAFQTSLVKLSNSLSHCHKVVLALETKVTGIQKKLQLNPFLKKSIYFLGTFRYGKIPQTVMANDGFVLSLKQFESYTGYPSDFAYLTWSDKILKTLVEHKLIAVSESRSKEIKISKISEKRYNLSYRGLLTPGIRQIYFLKELEKLSFR